MGITKGLSKIVKSVQEIFNLSFDEDFNLVATENLVYNPTTSQIDRMVQPGDATSAKQDSLLALQNNYTMAVEYDGSGNAIYVGIAAIGSSKGALVWQIKKITYDASNNATDIQWASGVQTFTKEWDERANYQYS